MIDDDWILSQSILKRNLDPHTCVGIMPLKVEMTEENNIDSVECRQDINVFKKSLPLQVALQEISKALGSLDGVSCLDVGVDNGMMSYHLRRLGGKWHSAVTNEDAEQRVRAFVKNNVDLVQGHTLPFKKKNFDIVVVFDYLERIDADDLFIEECHRVLQPDGRLILCVPNLKSLSLINPMRQALGMTASGRGWVKKGYTESVLFGILKHGFDVMHMKTYSRFLVEFTDTIVRSLQRRAVGRGGDTNARVQKILSIADPIYRLAFQLDFFLFFSKGFHIIATAKRRAWRPRNAPILSDGRSISEAVLSRATN